MNRDCEAHDHVCRKGCAGFVRCWVSVEMEKRGFCPASFDHMPHDKCDGTPAPGAKQFSPSGDGGKS